MRTAAGAGVMKGQKMITNAVSLIDLPGESPPPVLVTCKLIRRTKLVVKTPVCVQYASSLESMDSAHSTGYKNGDILSRVA